IYVANWSTSEILIFAAGLSGNVNVAPVEKISGYDTELATPTALAFDSSGKLYVANLLSGITVYAAGAINDAIPIRTITGTNTKINEAVGIALDPLNRIYVA